MITTLPCKCGCTQEYISLKEAAKIAGTHEKTILYWIVTKKVFQAICTQDTTGRKQRYVEKKRFLDFREATNDFREWNQGENNETQPSNILD